MRFQQQLNRKGVVATVTMVGVLGGDLVVDTELNGGVGWFGVTWFPR